jgi:hypothetical protein
MKLEYELKAYDLDSETVIAKISASTIESLEEDMSKI